MNKKKLSVVMAGAMLASSVSPVLAATESEVDSSKLGSLVEKVYNKLTEKTFTEKTSKLDNDSLAGKSVYYVEVNGVRQTQFDVKLDEAGKATLKNELQEKFKSLSAGAKVEIYSEGFREDADKDVVDCTTTEAPKYLVSDFAHTEEVKDRNGKVIGWENATTKAIFKILNDANKNLVENSSNVVRVETSTDGKDVIKVYFTSSVSALEGANVSGSPKVLTLKEGEVTYNFNRIINLNNNEFALTSGVQAKQIKSFVKNTVSNKDIAKELIETIKITGTTHNYATTDLYDGLMLTTEGHELLTLLKELDNTKGTSVAFETLDGRVINANSNVSLTAVNSEYGFVIKTKDAFNKETVYTIKGAKKQTEVLASWLNTRLAKVDILAGDNRYETAVSIAKEQVGLAGPSVGSTSNHVNKIVMVNGSSLVDGLSAAPLAAKLTAGTGKYSKIAAPVLLTEADELPKATKLYLKELMANELIGAKEKATIHLVGGTTVLSRSLEKELEDLGFKVVRYNGANREETSLKVAEKVGMGNKEVFVVGAEGEADAMSIAGTASKNEAPIIVSKKGGLTYDALKALEDEKVTVIGGEASVSAKDFEAIKEEATAVRRIAGENRQATNAAIIKEFYNDANGIKVESVIVAKDGKGNKSALVDALTAANLGAHFNAPVVLATNSLSEDQIDALNLRAKSSKSLYQVGIGVERSVVETIASKLGLLNK